MNRMNIYALKGHKVMVTESSMRLGYGETLEKHIANGTLELYKTYTIEKTVVGHDFTEVFLQEVPDYSFNSVNFEDIIKQPDRLKKLHLDYIKRRL